MFHFFIELQTVLLYNFQNYSSGILIGGALIVKNGFLRVGAASPDVKVANCKYNAEKIISALKVADEKECDLLVFPELSITGYTCGDLFLQEQLLKDSIDALNMIIESSANYSCTVVVGLPFSVKGSIYNAAAVVAGGELYGIVPKQQIPNYADLYEMRYFRPYTEIEKIEYVTVKGENIPFGNMIFSFGYETNSPVFGIEFAEELLSRKAPSEFLASNGAQIICNLSAAAEIVGKGEYRKTVASAHSGKNVCAYVYCESGKGESTSDAVYSGHKFIYENSESLAESKPFAENEILLADVDTELLMMQRRAVNTFNEKRDLMTIYLPLEVKNHNNLLRKYSKTPFIPENEGERACRMASILDIQAHGLTQRLTHVKAQTAVLGLSGGLDSTLALIVTAKAFEIAGLDKKNIHCITMPCFGTTDRTYNNACELARKIGATLIEINIKNSVLAHFADIGHDKDIHDVTYENSQARERTQILMDYANKKNGIVIGTGDLSELALGWATYNGDHMSMYAVNASIPKTLVRHLVEYFAEISEESLKNVLKDVLDTPVSPELLPPENGKISQKTEDLVGPYELHDFYLYYFKRYGFTPEKILLIACKTFEGVYTEETIRKWLKTFLRRFFTQQFKRSCMPDGPKVGTVALSPRGDWRMPSDADFASWTEKI